MIPSSVLIIRTGRTTLTTTPITMFSAVARRSVMRSGIQRRFMSEEAKKASSFSYIEVSNVLSVLSTFLLVMIEFDTVVAPICPL